LDGEFQEIEVVLLPHLAAMSFISDNIANTDFVLISTSIYLSSLNAVDDALPHGSLRH
jgi:hypothetical protein